MPTTTPQPEAPREAGSRIKEHALYLGDNGRCLCGQHLGYTASATGRDLSGQEIYQLQLADHQIGTPPFACEECGAILGRTVKVGKLRGVLIRKGKNGNCSVYDYAS